MKEVVKYEADDGRVFETRERCETYDKLMALTADFNEWYYYTGPLYGTVNNGYVSSFALLSWLSDNLEEKIFDHVIEQLMGEADD